MLKTCPHFLRGRLRESFNLALRERFRARLEGNVEAETRAWKLFGLIPVMLLHRPFGTGSVGRRALAQQVDDFARGLWTDLIQKACNTVPKPPSATPVRSAVEEQERRGKAAQSRVQRGQMSRAHQELTGAKLAPRDESTLEKLKRKRPQEKLQEISAEIIDFIPDRELNHEAKRFAECLRIAPSGSSPVPGGCSNQFLRVCFDDKDTLLLLTKAAEDFARATVPDQIFRALMTATMTALEKRDGGVLASPQALCSDDWSPRLWQDSLAKRSRQHVLLSNSHIPHAQEWIVWDMWCES